MEEKIVYDAVQIQNILPHRYPFLLVDKIVEMVDNERIVGVKCVTINEPFFVGHFPGRPVMPGALIMEAMAQTAAILAIKSESGVAKGKTVFLCGADEFKWKRPVVPGDTLRITMTSVKKRRPLWIMSGEVSVDGQPVAQGTLMAAEVD